jgi:hypothetical protein
MKISMSFVLQVTSLVLCSGFLHSYAHASSDYSYAERLKTVTNKDAWQRIGFASNTTTITLSKNMIFPKGLQQRSFAGGTDITGQGTWDVNAEQVYVFPKTWTGSKVTPRTMNVTRIELHATVDNWDVSFFVDDPLVERIQVISQDPVGQDAPSHLNDDLLKVGMSLSPTPPYSVGKAPMAPPPHANLNPADLARAGTTQIALLSNVFIPAGAGAGKYVRDGIDVANRSDENVGTIRCLLFLKDNKPYPRQINAGTSFSVKSSDVYGGQPPTDTFHDDVERGQRYQVCQPNWDGAGNGGYSCQWYRDDQVNDYTTHDGGWFLLVNSDPNSEIDRLYCDSRTPMTVGDLVESEIEKIKFDFPSVPVISAE